MSLSKWVNGPNSEESDFYNIIDYSTDNMKTKGNVFVYGCDENGIIEDMKMVKRAYHQENGKQYEHFVLSITPDLPSNPDKMYMDIGRKVADYYSEFQSVFSLHKDTEIRHVHFVLNSVSFKTGRKFSQGPPGLKRFKEYCNHILDDYNLDLIKINPEKMHDKSKHIFNGDFDFLEIHNDIPEKRISPLVDDLLEEDNRQRAYSYRNPDYPIYENENFFRPNYYEVNNMNYGNNGICQPYAPSAYPVSSVQNVSQAPARQQSETLSIGTYNNIGIEVNSLEDASALARTLSNGMNTEAEKLAEYASVGVQTKAELEKRDSFCNVHVGVYNDVHITVSNMTGYDTCNIIEADCDEIT